MKKTREETETGLEGSFYDVSVLCYRCPLCSRNVLFVVHPSRGEALSRGLVRGEHLRSHGIDHNFISQAGKEDPALVRELFQWNRKKIVLKSSSGR